MKILQFSMQVTCTIISIYEMGLYVKDVSAYKTS